MNTAQSVTRANHRIAWSQASIELHQRQLVIKRLQVHARFVGQDREKCPRYAYSKHMHVVAIGIGAKRRRKIGREIFDRTNNRILPIPLTARLGYRTQLNIVRGIKRRQISMRLGAPQLAQGIYGLRQLSIQICAVCG